MIFPDLKNKNIVITGSSSGIGKETLAKFSNQKANCIACVRKKTDEFIEFCKKLYVKNKKKIEIIEFDMLDNNKIKKGSEIILSKFKVIDVLVNNAGIVKNSLFLMTSRSDLENMFQVNFFSQVYFTQLILKRMIKQKNFGNVIFLSSSSSKNADYGRFLYSCTKSSILTLSKTLSKELSSYNIRVNSISPGLVNTKMTKDFISRSVLESEIKKTLSKRMADPKEISSVILFLASNESSYINGANISVDSGL